MKIQFPYRFLACIALIAASSSAILPSAWAWQSIGTATATGNNQENNGSRETRGKSDAITQKSIEPTGSSKKQRSSTTSKQDEQTGNDSEKRKEPSLKFVRVERSGDTPVSLQTAIARYQLGSEPYSNVQVDLVGAVHIGSREYYQKLNELFKDYDVVLYELVADADSNRPDMRESAGMNPLAGLQTGMKEALKLSYQLIEVDYSPKNFVHADMSPAEFAADMKERKDNFIGMFGRLLGAGIAEQSTKRGQRQQADLMAAMLSKDPIRMRRVLAEQFDSMEAQMAGFADRDGKSTILTERNRKAFEVLRTQLDSGKKKLAIFYGAAHLKDMHERLIKDYEAKLIELKWVDAWPLSDTASK